MLILAQRASPHPSASFASSSTSRSPQAGLVERSFSSNFALPAPPSSPINSPATLKGPYMHKCPAGAKTCPAPWNSPSVAAQGVMWSVLLHKISTNRFSLTAAGQGFSRSSATAGRQLLKTWQPCSSMLASSSRPCRSPIFPCMAHCCSGGPISSGTYSDGWYVRHGNAGAVTSIRAPVPVAISSASPLNSSLSGRRFKSVLRMGMRFRSALGWCCWPVMA
mmetsp:Transcript_98425/g.195191  ORF Transcript_98425/g.195191 Transcript_98425/m.195191 type:complete len:221 (-) Transcript_98425:160-822(-)